MVIKDYSVNIKTTATKLGKHVEAYIGSSYCILSCSKLNLAEFVSVVDEMHSKGWTATSGITSEDGKVFQSMSRLPSYSNQVNKNKGV